MSQITYTVGVLDGSAALVYSGTLMVQLQLDNYGSAPTAGLLTLQGLESVLLAGVSGAGAGWSLYGDNGSVNVSTLYAYPTGQQPGQAPPYLSGSIALATGGQPERKLLLLGYTGGGAAAVHTLGAESAAGEDTTSGSADAAGPLGAGSGATQYNWTLTLLDNAFQRTGTGAFKGTGQMMPSGPGRQRWTVTGTLTGDGFPAGGFPIQGGGSEDFWYGRSEKDPQLTFAVVASTYVQGVADGTLATSSGTSFFVGMPA